MEKKKLKDRFISWIIKNKVKSAIMGGLVILLLPLLVIELLYRIGGFCTLITTRFEATDILSYWRAFLVGIGTIALGALALYQNSIINKQAQDAQKRLEEIERNRDNPIFILSRKYSGSGNATTLPLVNSGQLAIGVSISSIDIDIDGYTNTHFKAIDVDIISQGDSTSLEYNRIDTQKNAKMCTGIQILYTDIHGDEKCEILRYVIETDKDGRLKIQKAK